MPPFTLPRPLASALSLLPQYPPALLFTRVVNLALGDRLKDDVWQPLRGRHIAILVRDAGLSLHFSLDGSGLVPRPVVGQPDLRISADTRDFLLLALRREDPDTLFFNRRLVMEGDTELGLLVKNTLDAMEIPPLDFRALLPGHFLGRIKARLLA